MEEITASPAQGPQTDRGKPMPPDHPNDNHPHDPPISSPTGKYKEAILLPSGLNSMLRNTTETGEIGIFSIKPSRLPRYSDAARAVIPQVIGQFRPQYTYQQRSHTPQVQSSSASIDERLSLSSYSRDAASETMSMYGARSETSLDRYRLGRHELDGRSFSLTQRTYQRVLANQRTYTSLKQPVDLVQAQRARSPFQYPARLKRPGFRPYSPAFTEGGIANDAQELEVEGQHKEPPAYPTTSSQPLTSRTNVALRNPYPTRSLSQSQPPQAVHIPKKNAHKDHVSRTPLKIIVPKLPPSTRGTEAECSASFEQNALQGSVPPQDAVCASPSYYDYSENFHTSEIAFQNGFCDNARPLSPPLFLLERTIHEDRELSSDWSYLAMSDLKGKGFLASEELLTVTTGEREEIHSDPMDTSYHRPTVSAKPIRNDSVRTVASNSSRYRGRASTTVPSLSPVKPVSTANITLKHSGSVLHGEDYNITQGPTNVPPSRQTTERHLLVETNRDTLPPNRVSQRIASVAAQKFTLGGTSQGKHRDAMSDVRVVPQQITQLSDTSPSHAQTDDVIVQVQHKLREAQYSLLESIVNKSKDAPNSERRQRFSKFYFQDPALIDPTNLERLKSAQSQSNPSCGDAPTSFGTPTRGIVPDARISPHRRATSPCQTGQMDILRPQNCSKRKSDSNLLVHNVLSQLNSPVYPVESTHNFAQRRSSESPSSPGSDGIDGESVRAIDATNSGDIVPLQERISTRRSPTGSSVATEPTAMPCAADAQLGSREAAPVRSRAALGACPAPVIPDMTEKSTAKSVVSATAIPIARLRLRSKSPSCGAITHVKALVTDSADAIIQSHTGETDGRGVAAGRTRPEIPQVQKLRLRVGRSESSDTVKITRSATNRGTRFSHLEMVKVKHLFSAQESLSSMFKNSDRRPQEDVSVQVLPKLDVESSGSNDGRQETDAAVPQKDVIQPKNSGSDVLFDGGVGEDHARLLAGQCTVEVQSCFSDDSSVVVNKTVRNRISSLRARLPAPAYHSKGAKAGKHEHSSTRITAKQAEVEIKFIACMDGANDMDDAPVEKPTRMRSKISTWLKGAKATIISCVRVRHGSDALDNTLDGK